ncbi:MAG: DMT family transporter [Acidiferrobacterales bacterium]|nr:DMT family transporter [Acidiferrobacterales bacterium]
MTSDRTGFGTTVSYLPFALILILGLIWGGVPSLSKYVTQQGVSPLSYSFWIFFTASIMTGSINFIRSRQRPPPYIVFYLVCGLTGSAIPTTAMYFAVVEIPAGLMVLLIAVTPIFTYIFSLITNTEKHHPLKTVGVLLAFVGIVLILLPDSIAEMKAPIGGVLIGFLAPAFYAMNLVYTARCRPADLHIMDMTTCMLVTATAVMFVATLLFEPLYPLWNAPPLVASLTLLQGLVTSIAFCLFFTLVKMSGALYSSQVTYSTTIIGIMIGAYVHDEVLPILVWIATLLMFMGIGIVQKARNLTKENTPGALSET